VPLGCDNTIPLPQFLINAGNDKFNLTIAISSNLHRSLRHSLGLIKIVPKQIPYFVCLDSINSTVGGGFRGARLTGVLRAEIPTIAASDSLHHSDVYCSVHSDGSRAISPSAPLVHMPRMLGGFFCYGTVIWGLGTV
jgi:hypothetical protein